MATKVSGHPNSKGKSAAIRELRRKNWIAAHIRKRRFELDLTQKDVAERAETSHPFILKLERGDHMPTISALKRILAVLGRGAADRHRTSRSRREARD